MIRIANGVTLDERDIELRFIRASGPGGQNVNKVATAVQLRFDINRAALPQAVRARLVALAGRRLSAAGVLVIDARRFRTQERNRQDAIERLAELLREAARRPKPRRKTAPSRAAKQRRLEGKRQRGETKRLRGPVA